MYEYIFLAGKGKTKLLCTLFKSHILKLNIALLRTPCEMINVIRNRSHLVDYVAYLLLVQGQWRQQAERKKIEKK